MYYSLVGLFFYYYIYYYCIRCLKKLCSFIIIYDYCDKYYYMPRWSNQEDAGSREIQILIKVIYFPQILSRFLTA